MPVNVDTDRYKVAVPALKDLLSAPAAMKKSVFRSRLEDREDVLDALVANDIVSTVEGKVEFQSRAAQFFVEKLPPPPLPPPKWWGVFGK
jgi:hypothetical protein